MLLGLTVAASVVAVALIVVIIYKLVDGASGSISKFGLAFLWHSTWNPSVSVGVRNSNVFGAGTLLFGTIVTSGLALVIRGAARNRASVSTSACLRPVESAP